MPAVDREAFWATVRDAADRLEHARNLRGKTRATCPSCAGKRHTEPSRTDYDAHGSYYVPAVDCRACGGRGRVEVACSAEVEAAAVQREIDRWEARLRGLRAKATVCEEWKRGG